MTLHAPTCDASLSDEAHDGAHFHTAMAHLYRGEMNRMTVWRQRLDTTSNWAIILIFSTSTLVLGGVSIPHFVMLLGLAIVTICLLIEARRYQRLHHSKWRLALFDHNYFAPMLWPQARIPEPYWRRQLACDLRRPHFTISWFMSSRLRLRRNYLMLFYFCTGVWLTKVFVHPQSPHNFGDFYARLAVGDLFPSWFVAGSACGFIVTASTLALLSPSEESLDHWTRERLAVLPDAQSSGTLAEEEERAAAGPPPSSL